MTRKKYKQLKRIKKIIPVYLNSQGIELTCYIYSTYCVNEKNLNEHKLLADVTIRMIDQKYTELIESQ